MIRQAFHASVAGLVALSLSSAAARAQDASRTIALNAHAIGLLTQSTGTPGNRRLTEAYLTQPMIGVEARAAWLHGIGTLNFEGATLRRGELDLGAWGEGYVDRRHPHTYIHELMLGAQSSSHAIDASLYGGRGFVPFGSDDPMTRPFVSYPVDHHLAQILERLALIGAARAGPVIVEAATFGGDEPLDPSTLPLARRFGDSWAVRGTLLPVVFSQALAGTELTTSYANVKSPEFRDGQGLDQRKLHAGIRFATDAVVSRYALLEFARTTDVDRGRPLYTFDALLAEGAVCRGGIGVAGRWERSDRPEEERLLDLFRTARPATDLSILGITQWTTLTGAVSLPSIGPAIFRGEPFFEVARVTADRTTAAVFDPEQFYGSNQMWRLSAGIRVGVGHTHERMGRYGVAAERSSAALSAPEGHHHSQPSRRCFS